MTSLKQIAIHVSRDLRRQQTAAEQYFWTHVKNKKFMGHKFLRQHPLFYQYDGQTKFFIADFYCSELKLIVEIDGGIHEQQTEYDKVRTELIKVQKDYQVIRFNNEEVIQECKHVMTKLKKLVINLTKERGF